jgi:hypothetical protein
MIRAISARTWRGLIVAAGVTGLVLGWGPPSDMLAPLVFFTDQSNILVAAYFTFVLLYPAGLRLAAIRESAALRGAITLYIVITGLVFHFVLATDKDPLHLLISPVNRTENIGTFLLHYTVPVMAVIDFLVVERRGRYQWRYAAIWLCYPLAYLGYALIRGAFFTVGSYPYPFLDVTEHGYGGVLVNVVEYAVFFYLLGLAVTGLGRWTRARGATGVASAGADEAVTGTGS